jgi:hypothetical protein
MKVNSQQHREPARWCANLLPRILCRTSAAGRLRLSGGRRPNRGRHHGFRCHLAFAWRERWWLHCGLQRGRSSSKATTMPCSWPARKAARPKDGNGNMRPTISVTSPRRLACTTLWPQPATQGSPVPAARTSLSTLTSRPGEKNWEKS